MTQIIEIIVGSTAGNTEYLATQIEAYLVSQGFETNFHDFPQFKEINFNHPILACIATHGAGDYPESLENFIEEFKQEQPNLIHNNFAILAVGDSSYDTYCLAAINARKLFLNQGANELIKPCFIDMLSETEPDKQAIRWVKEIKW